jgi:hypothetical protein
MGGAGHAPQEVGGELRVAAVTTGQLLYELRQACDRSSLVSHVEERVIDADVLSVRVHLTTGGMFISIFYNVTSGKTAFALLEGDRRIYGVDNARMGWHKHPFNDPRQHISCAAVRFEGFWADVEVHLSNL